MASKIPSTLAFDPKTGAPTLLFQQKINSATNMDDLNAIRATFGLRPLPLNDRPRQLEGLKASVYKQYRSANGLPLEATTKAPRDMRTLVKKHKRKEREGDWGSLSKKKKTSARAGLQERALKVNQGQADLPIAHDSTSSGPNFYQGGLPGLGKKH